MKDIILHTVLKFLTPIFVIFASYIHFHGELSPGGAFQAGSIMATFFIVYHIIFEVKLIEVKQLLRLSAIGIVIYALTGLAATLYNMNFLNYNYLYVSKHLAQKIGIMMVEMGIVLTVFSVFTSVYFAIEKFEG